MRISDWSSDVCSSDLFALPSAVQLGRLNAELAGMVEEQERTSHLLRQSEERVRLANAELERRVEERTADLSAANERLMDTLAELRVAKADLEGMVEERDRKSTRLNSSH